MTPLLRHCLAGLRRCWSRPDNPRPTARRRARPTLECLEDRAVPSTLSVVNLDSGSGSPHGWLAQAGQSTGGAATTASSAAPGAVVFRAADVPQPVDFPDVFTISSIDVGQSLTIASLKVQLDITYPLDNDLTIDLIAPDGTDVPLSYFEGYGANFQGTTF